MIYNQNSVFSLQLTGIALNLLIVHTRWREDAWSR